MNAMPSPGLSTSEHPPPLLGASTKDGTTVADTMGAAAVIEPAGAAAETEPAGTGAETEPPGGVVDTHRKCALNFNGT